MARTYDTALPLAQILLRILIIGNWLLGIGIVLLLFVLPHEYWLMSSLKLASSPDTTRFLWGFRAIAALGLVAIPLNYAMFSRLLAMVKTVRCGDAFIPANAYRLHAIAWALLGLELLSLVIGAIGDAISSVAHPLHLNAGFSPTGWLAVLLMFVLARVFAEGARMRLDLDGTI